MRITELTRIGEAPKSGTVLAYTRKEVIFHAYNALDDITSELNGTELLELHLFDSNKEYRAVMSESHRFKNGLIECVADFTDNVYTDKALLEGHQSTISTVCHIAYDSNNGMAYIDNYRLSK